MNRRSLQYGGVSNIQAKTAAASSLPLLELDLVSYTSMWFIHVCTRVPKVDSVIRIVIAASFLQCFGLAKVHSRGVEQSNRADHPDEVNETTSDEEMHLR